MSSELYLGHPSRDIHKWIIDSMYVGWDECTWVVDEERSTPEYLEEFKTLLETQHPVPKYNKKSVQPPSSIAEWGM